MLGPMLGTRYSVDENDMVVASKEFTVEWENGLGVEEREFKGKNHVFLFISLTQPLAYA